MDLSSKTKTFTFFVKNIKFKLFYPTTENQVAAAHVAGLVIRSGLAFQFKAHYYTWP